MSQQCWLSHEWRKNMANDDELDYGKTFKSVIGNFDDEADQAKFVELQQKNVADAERISEEMGVKGVPDSKRPI